MKVRSEKKKEVDDKLVQAILSLKKEDNSAAVDAIVKAIRSRSVEIDTKVISEAIERKDYSSLITSLAEKIDSLRMAIENRPDSFEFLVRRNEYGVLQKIIVTPVR